MKRTTFLTALLIIAGTTLGMAQQSMNIAMAGIKVKPMMVSITDINVNAEGNWKTVALNELMDVNHIPSNAKIQGIEINFIRSAETGSAVYDDIVKLIIPSSEEGMDQVSLNKSQKSPWSNSGELITLGGLNDNWGLGQVCMRDIKTNG
jgi:hypothetical protein